MLAKARKHLQGPERGLLEPYQDPVSVALKLWCLAPRGLLDDVLLDVRMQFASGNLVVLVGVSITLHALHQEVAEHPVLSFLERLGCLVACCCGHNSKAIWHCLFLCTDGDGAGGNQHVWATSGTGVADVEKNCDGARVSGCYVGEKLFSENACFVEELRRAVIRKQVHLLSIVTRKTVTSEEKVNV